MSNAMKCNYGIINVDGYSEMYAHHRTRALVLLAMVNLIYTSGKSPTKKEILLLVIEMQKHLEIPTLSKNSLKTIQDHLNQLVKSGHIYKYKFGKAENAKKKIGRGGPSRCYWPAFISLEEKKK